MSCRQHGPCRSIVRYLPNSNDVLQYTGSKIGAHSVVLGSSLWWPPAKIVGRYLSPFLAERAGIVLTTPPNDAGVPVAVDLDPDE